MRYRQQYDGEWFRPRMKAWYMRCCCCGSVHRVDFRVVGGKVEMRVVRLPKRATPAK